jgi:hypothetical protein
VRQLVDLEGESVGVTGDKQDDDAHEDDRRLFAAFLQTSKNEEFKNILKLNFMNKSYLLFKK